MTALEVGAAAQHLEELVGGVAARGERVTFLQGGAPLAVLVRPVELRSLEATVELLSDRDSMRRILEGESAIQVGDLLAGTDLGVLDPQRRFAMPGAGGSSSEGGTDSGPWDLVVSGPARRTMDRLPGHLGEVARRFIFERLTVDPGRYGIELRGALSRRFAARVETETIVYRLDSVKRSVRVIEVLHGAGLVGQPLDPGEALVSNDRLGFADATEGREGPVLERVLSRTDLVVYAGASGDFNPMHHDDTLATAAGMPSVFGHGMFSMGLVASALTAWVGPGRVRRFSVRFSKQTWPGETLRTRVAVTGRHEEGDRQLVDFECSLANAGGEVKVLGEATADLSAGD